MIPWTSERCGIFFQCNDARDLQNISPGWNRKECLASYDKINKQETISPFYLYLGFDTSRVAFRSGQKFKSKHDLFIKRVIRSDSYNPLVEHVKSD